MNQHKKDQHKGHGENEPLHIHLGDDEDEQDDSAEAHDTDVHDDGEVEVIRPHARSASGTYTRGRGLRNQPVPEDEEELPPSKTRIKKQMHELRDLGKELTELSKDQLAQLDIPESLRDARTNRWPERGWVATPDVR